MICTGSSLSHSSASSEDAEGTLSNADQHSESVVAQTQRQPGLGVYMNGGGPLEQQNFADSVLNLDCIDNFPVSSGVLAVNPSALLICAGSDHWLHAWVVRVGLHLQHSLFFHGAWSVFLCRHRAFPLSYSTVCTCSCTTQVKLACPMSLLAIMITASMCHALWLNFLSLECSRRHLFLLSHPLLLALMVSPTSNLPRHLSLPLHIPLTTACSK